MRYRVVSIAAAVALAYFAVLQFYGVNLGEEGATVFLAYRTARGELPYVDFISGYTPGYFYFHAVLFHVFGEHLSVVRVPLTVVQAANVALLLGITLRQTSLAWAVIAAAAYPALLPVVEESECSFNVPYPAWYCLLFFLVGWLVVRQALATASNGRWIAAGALCAVSFAWKPNSGLFQLAFTVWAASELLVRHRPLWAAALFGGGLVGIAAVFRHHLGDPSGWVFVFPLAASVAAWWRVVRDRAPAASQVAAPMRPVLCVGLGFAVLTLPWLVPVWAKLGSERTWRDVFFVGAGYEEYFFLPYRWSWVQFGAVAAAALFAWWWPARMQGEGRRLWAWLPVVAAVGVGAAYVGAAPMPEGPEAAVTSAIQSLAFVLLPLVHLLVAVYLLRSGNGEEGRDQRTEVALWSLGATTLFCNAYPRSDFFHVAYAAPLSFGLAAFVAQEYTRRWEAMAPEQARRCVRAAVPVLASAALVVCALPQMGVWARVAGFFAGRDTGVEWWDAPRAAVLVRRDGAGQDQRDFAAVARWLEQRVRPNDWLFTFPDLDLLGFLVGSRHPAAIGYFKSGWPGHAVEASVIDSLERRRPRAVVTASPPSLFFEDSPAYFFLLRQWLREHYTTVGAIGRYRIWMPAGAREGTSRTAAPPPGTHAGAIPDSCSRQTVRTLRHSGSVPQIRTWVAGWLQHRHTWEVGCSRLVLRIAGEQGDIDVGEALLSARLARESSVYDDWAGALWNIAIRDILAQFDFARGEAEDRRVSWDPEMLQQRLRWLDAEEDVRIRTYLLWSLVHRFGPAAWDEVWKRARPATSAAGVLERVLVLSRASGPSGAEEWPALLARLEDLPAIAPSLFLSWAQAHREASERVFVTVPQLPQARVRETLAFLAVAIGGCGMCPPLERMSATDSDASVRRAARWTRERLGCDQRCTSLAVSR